MPVSRIRPLPRFQAAPNALQTNSYFMPIAITTARMAQSGMFFFHGLALKYFMTFDCILLFTKQARLQSLACIIVCCLFELSFCLNRDVAVRAMDDAAGIKTPIVVCHSLDCSLVFAGESYACQTTAIGKHIRPDARHARRNRHRRQTAAIVKRIIPDARHTRRDCHRRQPDAIIKRLHPDASHAVRYHHRCQPAAL